MTNQEFEVCFNEVWDGVYKVPISNYDLVWEWSFFKILPEFGSVLRLGLCSKFIAVLLMHYPKDPDDLKRHCYKTLCLREQKYSFEDDRLWNFKKASKIDGDPPFACLKGMALKHMVSVMDIIEGRLSKDHAKEVFGDLCNYIVLGYALLKEDTR